MQLALEAAERARGRTSPNPIVGSVIVKHGILIASGYHKKAGDAHAEIMALKQAKERAQGADVYVTLEPCAHHGRTGPCAAALIEAGVKRVFVGIRDLNPLVQGRGIRALRQAGIEVFVGVLASECRRQNEAFFHYIQHKRPFVIVKSAQSLDGKIATYQGDARWITSEASRRYGHRLRNECDVIVVGVGTVLTDNPTLNCRLPRGRDPVRLVVDSEARTPVNANIVRIAKTSLAKTLIAVTNKAPQARCRALSKAGAELIVCPSLEGRVDLPYLLDELGRREFLSLLVEGGPTLTGALFDAHLVNKVLSFVAPRILGNQQALSAVGGTGAGQLSESIFLHSFSIEPIGPDFLITGYPHYP